MSGKKQLFICSPTPPPPNALPGCPSSARASPLPSGSHQVSCPTSSQPAQVIPGSSRVCPSRPSSATPAEGLPGNTESWPEHSQAGYHPGRSDISSQAAGPHPWAATLMLSLNQLCVELLSFPLSTVASQESENPAKDRYCDQKGTLRPRHGPATVLPCAMLGLLLWRRVAEGPQEAGQMSLWGPPC